MNRKTSNRPGNRRGSALMLVLLFTLALGGLAISAIYMNGTTHVVSKLYDRERDYRYAAEWALAMGKSRISRDTTLILADSGYVQLASNVKPQTVGGQNIPLVSVDLYAGLSGVTTGQYGKAVSLVAVASDSSGARHVRRLELLAENFAVYAVFVDNWQAGLCYTGEIIRGGRTATPTGSPAVRRDPSTPTLSRPSLRSPARRNTKGAITRASFGSLPDECVACQDDRAGHRGWL